MKSKSIPRTFHKNLIQDSQVRLGNISGDIFYRFMKELPYKLLPQSKTPTCKPPSHPRTPSQHYHKCKEYEKLAQSSPLAKKKKLIEARLHSKTNSLSDNDLQTNKR